MAKVKGVDWRQVQCLACAHPGQRMPGSAINPGRGHLVWHVGRLFPCRESGFESAMLQELEDQGILPW